ncbi:unannotated protein [freshwater metagenome]|uniref:Unannotated protein n=1 Tax=freshwater metagenome TaxID=449393 RepID=A0A6J7DRX2_9ZZZZ|nr:HD domain-containing protein [Actinomycetota bacterium]
MTGSGGGSVGRIGHLGRRFLRALSRRAPARADQQWALSCLTSGEAELWSRLSNADQRHSLEVARRFEELVGHCSHEETAAALLHDIGKLECGLGTFGRVIATLVGPHTARFRSYHDHERIGAEQLRAAGSAPLTVALVEGSSERTDLLDALRRADDI